MSLKLTALVVCVSLSVAAGQLLGAGSGQGSCSAPPYRSRVVEYWQGCPEAAPCCNEYGYCRPQEEWLRGVYRDCNQMSNGLALPDQVFQAEQSAASRGDKTGLRFLVVPRQNIFGSILQTVGGIAQGINNGIAGTVSGIGNGISGIAQGAGSAIGGIASGAGNAVGGIANGAGNVVGGLASGAGNAVGGAATGAGNVVGGVANGAGNAVGGVANGAGTAIGGVANGAGNVVGGIATGTGNVVSGVSNGVGNAVNGGVSNRPSGSNKVNNAVQWSSGIQYYPRRVVTYTGPVPTYSVPLPTSVTGPETSSVPVSGNVHKTKSFILNRKVCKSGTTHYHC